MSKAAGKSRRVRIFVALDLPKPIRDGVAAWEEAEVADPALRRVPSEALHITLAFLGQRPREDADRVAQALEAVAGAAPSIALRDPVPRPGAARPRLFALPASSPATEELHGRLSGVLVSEGLYKPEKRPFWPHLTVARVRSEGGGSRRPLPVSKPPGELPEALSRPFRSVRLALYRSELQPSGARYVPLAQVELSAADGSEG
jgi:2'-5' RNA ligase